MKNTSRLLGFNCERELAKEIELQAQREGKSTSEYVRDLLYGDLADTSEGGETAPPSEE
jgi:hypothetical protein